MTTSGICSSIEAADLASSYTDYTSDTTVTAACVVGEETSLGEMEPLLPPTGSVTLKSSGAGYCYY